MFSAFLRNNVRYFDAEIEIRYWKFRISSYVFGIRIVCWTWNCDRIPEYTRTWMTERGCILEYYMWDDSFTVIGNLFITLFYHFTLLASSMNEWMKLLRTIISFIHSCKVLSVFKRYCEASGFTMIKHNLWTYWYEWTHDCRTWLKQRWTYFHKLSTMD